MEHLYALLIGVDRYDPNPRVENLHGAVADVLAMEEFLLRCGVPAEHITKLTSSHPEALIADETAPTYEAMVDGMRALARRARQASGTALIHYSGHGGRIQTLIPRTKGEEGLDEGLVPPDLRAANACFLHDVELTFLLDEFARQGVPVTLILDACHSGGMMRRPAAGLRRRRARGVWDGPRRTESRVASIEEMERVWQKTHYRSWRHSRRGTSGWTAKGVLQRKEVAILAACRKRESAIERDFGNGPRGTFTHCLLELLARGTAMDSWDEAHRELVNRMRRLPRPQWPVFEGTPSPMLFKNLRRHREHPISVVRVETQGRRVLLDAGMAVGVAKGALLALRSSDETVRVPPLVEVEDASAGEAWAVVRGECEEGAKIELGDTAVVVDPGVGLEKRVVWVGEEGTGEVLPAAFELVRRELEQRKTGFLNLQPAGTPGPPAHFQVGVCGGEFELLRAGGQSIPGVPGVGQVSRRAARRLVDQLLHLAHFLLVRDLANRDESSEVGSALVAELGLLPVGYQPGDGCQAVPLDGAWGRPEVANKRWIALEVANRSSQALHLYVLDLQPDWGIELIHPKCGLTTLEGGRRICLPFEIYLPEGLPGGREILQVLGVIEPARPAALCLPAIEHAGSQTWRSASGGPVAGFDQFLRRVGVAPRRWRSAFRRPSRGWSTAQVEFEVVVEPTRGP